MPKNKSRKKIADTKDDPAPMITDADCDSDQIEEPSEIKYDTYLPGRSRPLEEDEELVMDKSAYRLFYDLQLESSSLSFDIIRDNLGDERAIEMNGAAISLCLIAGTQASPSKRNKLVLMRLDNLLPMKDRKKKENDEDDDSDSSSDEDEEDLDLQPEVESASVMHPGTVNRVRVKCHEGRTFAASWSEQGKVFIWDLTRPLNAVNDSVIMAEYTRSNETPSPLTTFKGHNSEGFAVDWSPCALASGHLATGDCGGVIYHWQPRQSNWHVSPTPYTGHKSSIEDIQWSISEPTVFISVSADCSIKVWDIRSSGRKNSMLTIPGAHPADVNVASWNRLQSNHFVTGGDDGGLRVWDLRCLSNGQGPGSTPPYTHSYTFHDKPITSVEWHPTDAGVFVASSEDNQITVWDTSAEKEANDAREDGQPEQQPSGDAMDVDGQVPDQLMFIHSGQREVKEVHWHSQLPGLLISTALDGLNVWRTCNI